MTPNLTGPSRRSVLGGLAALPIGYGLGSATPAFASPRVSPTSADPARGEERRYHAPLLTPGTRLLLPAGVKAVPIKDFYRRPHLGPAAYAWPHLRASDGRMIDASIVPEPGAPTRVALLSGFTEGWYEVRHATGRADRVTWDVGRFPLLWFYGEFGATNDGPFHDRFFTLALQPLSHNPYRRL
jgi:hypothetical protein